MHRLPGEIQKGRAFRGKGNLVSISFEKRNAKFFFKPRKKTAQGGGAQVYLRRGPGEVKGVGKGEKCFKLMKVHYQRIDGVPGAGQGENDPEMQITHHSRVNVSLYALH
jgi:hypothetical protein